ncbi:enoyl-CoA hydratase-related protein [Rhizobium sp. LC145]|uniref:enoyl-CoA hydratase/isomerase family protein n=1 Tax=Rhizobium sp. LC145 TaxID=1120688 RepID=UPI00069972CF|nr:enoyl-CoA hydratase-related protein [Rhizobium sp. LC145]TKT68939.1 3-hydroxybutyryl-CoA dehydratase [Rhizobiaceae bacterium LC148]
MPDRMPQQSVTPPQGGDVLVETLETGAAAIWLNRPGRLNALGSDMVVALTEAVNGAIAAGASAIVLRGKGRGFCAGADLKERQGMDAAGRYQHNRAINAAVNALAAAPVPTVAAINGAALGGGLELALACDIRIAAEGASLGLTESRLGAIPGAGGTQRLPRLIGISRALDMMYTGEPISARRAYEIGLVNACIPDEELDKAVADYMALLGSRSAATARVLKQVVHEGHALPLADGLERERQALGAIFGSDDYAEGLAAFAEKRPPRFSR